MNNLPPNALALRDLLLSSADEAIAIKVANRLVDQALDGFNDANTSVGTSLLARAMMARAMIGVGATWWADLTNQPEPVAWAALHSLVTDLPVSIDQVSVRKDEG